MGKVGSAGEGQEEAGQLERGRDEERECAGEDGGGRLLGGERKWRKKEGLGPKPGTY